MFFHSKFISIFFIALALAACKSSLSPTEPNPTTTNHAPVVNIVADITEGIRPIDVHFTANATDADGDTLSYTWNVGDDSYTGKTLSLTFLATGSYQVSVTVSDGKTTATDYIEIKALPKLRPTDSPDVVIIGFSGRCGIACIAPGDNREYLYAQGTLEVISNAFASIGLSTVYTGFAGKVSYTASNNSAGYYQAQELLNRIKTHWIADYDNPTRLVLAGHSHGATWASLLAYENLDVAFDYLIYIDAVCNSWEEDNLRYGIFNDNLIAEFYESIGRTSEYPQILIPEGACESHYVASKWRHLKDIVPLNVGYALEIQAAEPLAPLPDKITPQLFGFNVYDQYDNIRADGSAYAIYRYKSNTEYHEEISKSYSAAIRWVGDFIKAYGLYW